MRSLLLFKKNLVAGILSYQFSKDWQYCQKNLKALIDSYSSTVMFEQVFAWFSLCRASYSHYCDKTYYYLRVQGLLDYIGYTKSSIHSGD